MSDERSWSAERSGTAEVGMRNGKGILTQSCKGLSVVLF